ncbi:hypothetical protein [Moraxella bovis]|uniref:Uncharacterized protein n=1 Tax=Moraxella bovis TaxID=476 RepID=A0A378PQT6_MORBO|nr:hypothetical protein [Moraxella bovis]UYZ70670.1 hypothetical protein LP089_11265 [Moraxella bovis]UYZ73396.1 hypothetical protein LP105_01345 [Moraxella bovis]UYZ75978.1 hypothetical protein LP093_01165 [Moraxella bovis]UYZ78069.1 hypothetical protein LP115_12630 [Moraxella bovis]UYZ80964.1 hypothetical protein LP113_13310 [Moraxella bovis]
MCQLCNINLFVIHDALVDEHDNTKPSADEKSDNENPDSEQAYPVSGGAL